MCENSTKEIWDDRKWERKKDSVFTWEKREKLRQAHWMNESLPLFGLFIPSILLLSLIFILILHLSTTSTNILI